MTTFRMTSARRRMLPWAAVFLLTTGCGAQRADDGPDAGPRADPAPAGTAAMAPAPVPAPGTPSDSPCPGESPTPTAPGASGTPGTSAPSAPPADHYAENHAFRIPLPLHGQSRCDGLAAVGRVEHALEPLRRRGDFAPESVRSALSGLGYATGKVHAYQNGPTGVGFLVDIGASPWCVEGTMSRDSTRAEAFGGYPDGTGCEPPRGGH
ncbi:hypothetical protein WDV06_05360 [Streptomyces racemochromogenes]|uniref:Lipoprotein n=1 Tax=Streptomyces racemochromogenes TaxID=67353 RepID=A0ABW7P865_9ACTN